MLRRTAPRERGRLILRLLRETNVLNQSTGRGVEKFALHSEESEEAQPQDPMFRVQRTAGHGNN